MKNVFSRAFTNISSLFTPPAIRKRARTEDQSDLASEAPSRKAARTLSGPASAGDNNAANDFARELESAATDLPLSRPAVSPLGSLVPGVSPAQLDQKQGLSHQHQQHLQPQSVSNQAQSQHHHTFSPQPSSRHTAVKRPSPLSKVTYAAGTPSAFGSNFSVEGSGLKLLQGEPGSCWAGAAPAHAGIESRHLSQAAPTRVSAFCCLGYDGCMRYSPPHMHASGERHHTAFQPS